MHGVHLRDLHSLVLHFRHYRGSPDRPVVNHLLLIRPRNEGLVELLLTDVRHRPTNSSNLPSESSWISWSIFPISGSIVVHLGSCPLKLLTVQSRYPASRHWATAFGLSMFSPIAKSQDGRGGVVMQRPMPIPSAAAVRRQVRAVTERARARAIQKPSLSAGIP